MFKWLCDRLLSCYSHVFASADSNDVTVFVGTKNINEEFKINFGLKAKMPKKSFGKKL